MRDHGARASRERHGSRPPRCARPSRQGLRAVAPRPRTPSPRSGELCAPPLVVVPDVRRSDGAAHGSRGRNGFSAPSFACHAGDRLDPKGTPLPFVELRDRRLARGGVRTYFPAFESSPRDCEPSRRSTDGGRRWPFPRLHPRARRRGPRRGQARRAWPRAFRRSRTATCTSATPSRSASTSASPQEYGGQVQPALRRHEPERRRSRSTSSRSWTTCAGSASSGTTGSSTPRTTSSSSTSAPIELIEQGQGLRLRPARPSRSASTAARSPSPARNSPYRDRTRGENLDLFRPHARRRVPRRRADAAREDRHGVARTSTCATRCMYRILHAPAPPHGRRRGASTRCTTGRTASRTRIERHHALDLHARVREPPAALRLVPRRSSAIVRTPQQIEFARLEPDLHRAEQAQAARSSCSERHVAAGTIRACRRSRGLRRRGYTPEAIRDFCERIGVAKCDSTRRRRAARARDPRGSEPHARRA